MERKSCLCVCVCYEYDSKLHPDGGCVSSKMLSCGAFKGLTGGGAAVVSSSGWSEV